MTANLTPQTTPDGSWSTLQTQLKPEVSGERYPFYPIGQMEAGKEYGFRLIAGPFFKDFHGQYSLVEMDVQTTYGQIENYRLCVSGARLARALAALAPIAQDRFVIAPIGSGKERTWSVRKD